MVATLKCRDCRRRFKEVLNKRGYRNQCPDCSLKQDEPEPIGGNMVWHHKTAPELELKPMAEAVNFARKTRRFGAGVTKCLTQSKEAGFKKEFKE